ncbi:CCA tRNA nucleotidyltransferase [Halosegnis marinus]|uniref:CCA-adding enzyme n=1 Tax=Halosegnis marinus TaxID=3034023 RepID=A0ABD5ZPR5_9EURY|nr:CCA tRNA nucleotidyltransferase [Halosegnis sp. DT85]
MTPPSFAAVVERVSERVTPDAAERARLDAAATALRERAEDALADLDTEADVLLVGSTARGTWLAGDRDIDVFVRFPPDLPRDRLEAYGLAVGHAVLADGHEEYAEHPYVKGTFEGFDVDCVPCYDVDSAADIRSAVDRTPFHTAYVESRLDDDLAADVRVTKAFLKGIGAYGSDLRTKGFAGYLAELLVLDHGGFRPLVAAAADWSPPVRFDPEGHGTRSFDDALVVVDPTDPERNVAASLSESNLARLIHYSRELLADPRESLFEPRDPDPLDADAVRERVEARGTHPVAVRFPAPGVVEDQLYPQLDKSLAGLEGALARRGFAPLRSARFADETAVLFVECEVAELPAVERHEGPPVGVREHATGFFEVYVDDDAVTGPYLDGDRYVVERPRDHLTPESFAASDDLFSVALGPAVERALDEEYGTLAGAEVAALADEFGTALARYFEPRV